MIIYEMIKPSVWPDFVFQSKLFSCFPLLLTSNSDYELNSVKQNCND